MYRSIYFASCFLLSLTFSISAQTDTFLEKHQEYLAKKPKDINLTLSLKENQTKFQQGEVIYLELEFTSSSSDKYTYLNRTYDRSGRLYIDGFILDKKEKTFDPLYDYFFRHTVNLTHGGIFNSLTLDSKPQIMKYELNEFMSFKEAGKYRLYISSPRVSLNEGEKDKYSNSFYGNNAISLVSNIVEFEILPTNKEWQSKKLAEIVKALPESSNDETIRKHCKTLRFLGTKAAAKEMIMRYSRDNESCNFDNYIGLYGSPERKFIVDEMNRMLISPDFAVTGRFFQMLLNLDFFLNNPEHKKTKENIFGLETKEEKESKNTIELQYLETLSKAISDKNKSAFSESLETFFSYSAEGEKQPSAELTNALTNSFSKLSKQKQYQILRNSWDKLKNPAMIPILQEIYNSFGDTNLRSTRITNESFEEIYDRDIFNLSIKAIYEIDQNIGKQIILNEMRRPKQRVFIYILKLLPNDESPEAINILLEKLILRDISKSELDSVFSLIDYFQTPELISKLRENYANRIDTIGCEARLTLLKTFLNLDVDFGAKLLKKAIDAKVDKDCYSQIMANTIEPHWSPKIEKIVLVALENDDLYIYDNAVKLLGKYGSIDVREKLWKRFERFNKEEQNKKDFLEKKDDLNNWQTHIAEQNFAIALSESPNWWFDYKSQQRLSRLCLYDSCKKTAEELSKIFGTPARIESSVDEKGYVLFSIYQYKNMSLEFVKKKLDQFQPDTTFKWFANEKNPNDEKHFLELKAFVEERRMNLIK